MTSRRARYFLSLNLLWSRKKENSKDRFKRRHYGNSTRQIGAFEKKNLKKIKSKKIRCKQLHPQFP
jgi:hypothetical protein